MSSKRTGPLVHEDEGYGQSSGRNGKARGRNAVLIRHTPFVASTNPPHQVFIQKVRSRMAANRQAGMQQREQALSIATVNDTGSAIEASLPYRHPKAVRPREVEATMQQRGQRQKVNDANDGRRNEPKQMTRRNFSEAMKQHIQDNQEMAKRTATK